MKIIVIGAGPAGETAASTLKKLDKTCEVLLIEKDEAGGVCLNRGCIPSKTFLDFIHKSQTAGDPVDWGELQKRKDSVVRTIRGQLEARLKKEGVLLIKGEARFSNPTSIAIKSADKDEAHTFDKAIIAAGTDIFYPPPLDQFKNQILSSDTLLELTATPASILIIGGGAVGCEFACLLQAAGTQVTLVEMKDQLIPGEDAGITSALQAAYEKRGISVRTGTAVKELKPQANGFLITLSNGETISTEKILSCAGRTPAPHKLGLEKAGVKIEKGRLVLNAQLQTSNPNIFAAGDVATSRLAHHAAEQGKVAAANALGAAHMLDERFIPRCLYSWPEVASVGLAKWQVEEQGRTPKVARSFFRGSGRALAAGDGDGFVQIVSDPQTGLIYGAQIIGAQATELIHIFSVALKAGMTTQTLSQVIFAHPTLAEAIKDAAGR